ncbi:uncharacterized protein TM35_000761050 [Trypanosoma theileri]|uniref:Mucin TcMUCII n=1 Tax=Trypanosoma theileri TaxID=67003 RepID=A0A1X0NF25_9TRYP|nr:uncharacterized protein TM35_000761050 [Trypanosoma theileri]ORC83160.1 hypothetical protein TM35_000761050 [Trypanosoma theileri]
MMMRTVVCFLVFLLSVASVCMEANAFTNEPFVVAGDGNGGDVFTALFNENLHPYTPDCAGSSNLCGRPVTPEKQIPAEDPNSVPTDQERLRAGERLSTTEETSSRREQDAGKEMDKEKITRADSPSAEDGRGDDIVGDIPAPQPGHNKPGTGGEPNLGEQIQPPESTPPTQGNPGSSNNRGDNSTTGDSNPTEQASPAEASTTNATASQENGSVDSTATNTNTTTEAPTTTTLSPVPNAEINTITSTVQKKTNVDSSVSSVWMGTAAPLMIVVVLFSATVC